MTSVNRFKYLYLRQNTFYFHFILRKRYRKFQVLFELQAQETADLLNMSRSTLIKLLDANALRHSRKGNRRKVAFVDVMKYKKTQDEKRLAALDELSELDQEMDMGY